MKITSVDGSKFMVETTTSDIGLMQNSLRDVIMGEIAKGLIETIKSQILADEEYMRSIKEAVKKRLDELKITNVEFF